MSAPLYSIGSSHLPGLSKCIEEIGELSAILGKILGLGHDGQHWDQQNLRLRCIEEMADAQAAIYFYGEMNFSLEEKAMLDKRRIAKIAQFTKWQNKGSIV